MIRRQNSRSGSAGSIASELVAGWHKKPAFLVGCRTSKGMSGSPVIRRLFGPAASADMTVKLDAVVTSQFMGIYSGRLHDDESVANIELQCAKPRPWSLHCVSTTCLRSIRSRWKRTSLLQWGQTTESLPVTASRTFGLPQLNRVF